MNEDTRKYVQDGLAKLPDLRDAHIITLLVRRNGQDERYAFDYFKHLLAHLRTESAMKVEARTAAFNRWADSCLKLRKMIEEGKDSGAEWDLAGDEADSARAAALELRAKELYKATQEG